MSYDAILLTSFGGPESLEDVMGFLERVTAGRGVPRQRLEEVSHHYVALGGVSPINEQNRQLLSAIKIELASRDIDTPIYLGNRNSPPFNADVLQEMHRNGHTRVLALATSAYSSYSGCRQYCENLASALLESNLNGKMVIDKVRQYFDHPGFIEPFTQGLVDALSQYATEGMAFSAIKILFTTHSIPLEMADTSGPPGIRDKYQGGAYVAQHRTVAELVIQRACARVDGQMPAWQLVYQSRSGSPHTPWLVPDIGEAIKSVADEGYRGVIVIPIGFVSDHVEVMWDLDKEAKEIAQSSGLDFKRTATPGLSKTFVTGLVDLISERTQGSERKALSEMGPWSDFCLGGCCPNLKQELPTVAGIAG